MKITQNQLAELISEEIETMVENGELDEGFLDRLKARGAGVGTKLRGAGSAMVQKGVGKVAALGAKVGGGEAAKTAAAELAAAAKETRSGSQAQALGKKQMSIMNSHLKALMTDLEKLGIDMTTPGIKGALSALQKAVKETGTLAQRAAGKIAEE